MRGVLLAGQTRCANLNVGAALKIDTLAAKFTRFSSKFSIQSRNENTKLRSIVRLTRNSTQFWATSLVWHAPNVVDAAVVGRVIYGRLMTSRLY